MPGQSTTSNQPKQLHAPMTAVLVVGLCLCQRLQQTRDGVNVCLLSVWCKLLSLPLSWDPSFLTPSSTLSAILCNSDLDLSYTLNLILRTAVGRGLRQSLSLLSLLQYILQYTPAVWRHRGSF